MTPPSMVERVTSILDAFDQRPTARLNLDQVVARTGLPRSTTHRILRQLVGLAWLDYRDAHYCLGSRALGLGGQDGLHGEIRKSAAEHLHQLHLRTGLVVHLAALEGTDEVYLDKIGGHFAAALPSKIGTRQRAYLTTGGRAMLAWLAPEEVDARCGAHPDLTALHLELAHIRRAHGISIDRGAQSRMLVGVELPSVAAAVRGADGPVAAICLAGAANSVPIERVVPLVAEAAARTSAALEALG